MKSLLTLKYIISIWVFVLAFQVQAQDTLSVNESKSKFGLYNIRLGVDISRPIIQAVQKEDVSTELTLDLEIYPNWFVALEAGNESEPGSEDYFTFHTQGNYTRIGFNYNTYKDWAGLNNEVYVGLRYGYSSFSQRLISYNPLDFNEYFGSELQEPNTLYEDLGGHWGELVGGLKVEVLHNLYLTAGIQFKKLFKSKNPDGFANLYIPGFYRVYANKLGFGFNYTIAYKIPLKKKEKKEILPDL